MFLLKILLQWRITCSENHFTFDKNLQSLCESNITFWGKVIDHCCSGSRRLPYLRSQVLRDSEEACFIIYKSTVFWLFVAAACPDTKIALCCWTVGLHSPTGHRLVYEIPNCFLAIFCFSSVRGLTGHSQLFWEQYFRSSACTCVRL